MTAKQPYPTRRQLRKEWEKQQESQPLTRKEIRRREREEEARLAAIATGELTLTGEVPGLDVPDGELMPPRPPRKPGEPEPTRRSLREEAARRLEEETARREEEAARQRAEEAARRRETAGAEGAPPASQPTRRALRESQQFAAHSSSALDLPSSPTSRDTRSDSGGMEVVGGDNRDDISGAATQSWRRRVVTPPATAQGVKVLDHATGEIRTLHPEEYTAPRTQEERDLAQRIQRALPPVEEEATTGPSSRQPDAEAQPQPQRVSLFAKDDDLSAAAATESDGPQDRAIAPAAAGEAEATLRANHPFEPVSSNSEPSEEPAPMTRAQLRQERQAREEDAGGPDRMSRTTKIILAIVAIVVLAVVVWLVWSSAALAAASATVVVGKYEGEMCLPLLTRRN